MTSNTRRPGFRLWGGDSADEPDEQTTDAQAEQADATEAAAPEVTASDAAAEAPAPSPAAPPPAPSPAAEPPSPESAGFLASLVDAMRSVADEARAASLAELRTSVDTRVAELEAAAAERAEDLRRQAELDINGIGDWQRDEIERVRAEAERKTATRRQQLEQQLADHQGSVERQVASTRGRLEEHERELGVFFGTLEEIKDPAAFVAAAKRMPRPPQFGDASAASAPRQTLDMRLAQLGVETAEAPEAAEAGQATAADETTDATATATEAAEAAPETEAPAEEPAATEATSAETAAPEEATVQADDSGRDAELAQRLAELDERLADTAPETPAAEASDAEATADAAPAEEPAAAAEAPAAPESAASNGATASDASGETSTAIVVKGLGSFGAITSFKQALERVEGIEGVTLSLGPTGEFVYRASHAAGFDLVAAVRSIEGASAEIERSEGALRVSVNRNR